MTSRKLTGVLVFLIPLALGVMAAGRGHMLMGAREALEMSPTTFGLASLASLGGLVAGLVAGPAVDWKGPRLLIVAGGLVAALGLLIQSTASSLLIVLIGGFLASAGVGLAGGIVIQVLVADWFIQYRGTFLGLALLGPGLGSGLASPLSLLVDDDSWRVVARVFALVGVGVAIAGFTFIRNYPARGEEDDPSKVKVPGRRPPQLERMIPAGQYVRIPGLWRALVLLALASAAVLGASSGLSLSARFFVLQLSGIESMGVVVWVFGIGSAVGALGWSVGADFWARERLLWLSGSGAVVLLVLLALLSFAFPYVFVIGAVLFVAGLFLGGLSALIGLTFVDYMGVRLLGTLSVAFGFLADLGGSAGHAVAGLLIDGFGFPWSLLLGAPLIALAVLVAIRVPYPVIELEKPAPLS